MAWSRPRFSVKGLVWVKTQVIISLSGQNQLDSSVWLDPVSISLSGQTQSVLVCLVKTQVQDKSLSLVKIPGYIKSWLVRPRSRD